MSEWQAKEIRINEAEIERLRALLADALIEIERLRAEVETLQAQVDSIQAAYTLRGEECQRLREALHDLLEHHDAVAEQYRLPKSSDATDKTRAALRAEPEEKGKACNCATGGDCWSKPEEPKPNPEDICGPLRLLERAEAAEAGLSKQEAELFQLRAKLAERDRFHAADLATVQAMEQARDVRDDEFELQRQELIAAEAKLAEAQFNLGQATDALRMAREAAGPHDRPFLDDAITELRAELAAARDAVEATEADFLEYTRVEHVKRVALNETVTALEAELAAVSRLFEQQKIVSRHLDEALGRAREEHQGCDMLDAVAEERKALREIVRFEVRLMPDERAAILGALDARSKP